MSTSPVEMPHTFLNTGLELFSDLTLKVADLSPATVAFGRKEIELAEHEMPGEIANALMLSVAHQGGGCIGMPIFAARPSRIAANIIARPTTADIYAPVGNEGGRILNPVFSCGASAGGKILYRNVAVRTSASGWKLPLDRSGW